MESSCDTHHFTQLVASEGGLSPPLQPSLPQPAHVGVSQKTHAHLFPQAQDNVDRYQMLSQTPQMEEGLQS